MLSMLDEDDELRRLVGCWRYVRVPDAATFLELYANDPAAQAKHPLITTCTVDMELLPLCRAIVPLAQWYALVRRVFEGQLDRSEVMGDNAMNHDAAVNRMVNLGYPTAFEMFSKFQDAWNTIVAQQAALFGGRQRDDLGHEVVDEEAPYGRMDCDVLTPFPEMAPDMPFGFSLLSQQGDGYTLYCMLRRLTELQTAVVKRIVSSCESGNAAHRAVQQGAQGQVVVPRVDVTRARPHQVISAVVDEQVLAHVCAHTSTGHGMRLVVNYKAAEDRLLQNTFVGKVEFDAVDAEKCGFGFKQERGLPFLTRCHELYTKHRSMCAEVPVERVRSMLETSDLQPELQNLRGKLEVLLSQLDVRLLGIGGQEQKVRDLLQATKLETFASSTPAPDSSALDLLHRCQCSDLTVGQIFSLFDVIYERLVFQEARAQHVQPLEPEVLSHVREALRENKLVPAAVMCLLRRFYVTTYPEFQHHVDHSLNLYTDYVPDAVRGGYSEDAAQLPESVCMRHLVPLYMWLSDVQQ